MSECPRICIIGAGISGICAGVQLKDKGLTNYTIFDENEEVGGCWLVNTYPGCACDIPTHLYSFSFHQNSDWTSLFCTQPEILEYLKEVARKHKLYEKIKFQCQVKRAIWDETIQKWRVSVYDNSNDYQSEIIFDIVIRALGGLRTPNIPKQFETFKGPMMHSARWDSSIELTNKTVGIIGSGSSAVQIVPEITKYVKKLIVYQRHPAWVFPKLQFNYPSWIKWMFKKFPIFQKLQRASIFIAQELQRPVYTFNSALNKIAGIVGKIFLKIQLGTNSELIEKLTPNYIVGCKRVTQSNEFYSSLASPNVHVIRSGIKEVKEHSIITHDGEEEKLDVLILATGFRVQDSFAPLEIQGTHGINMWKVWKTEGPSTYLGILSSIAPNSFELFGPYSVSGNNSAIFSIECQVNWVVKVIQEMVRRHSKVVSIRSEAEKAFMQKVLEDLKSTTWQAGNCSSWHTDHRGIVTTHNPSGAFSYWNQTRRPDFTHLSFD